MRALLWTTCFWPGLAALWLRGRWSGLALAVAFGLALQFALLCAFAPGELPSVLSSANPIVAWLCVLSLWITGVWNGSRQLKSHHQTREQHDNPELDQWFREAQTEYLKGHWIEAETLLARLLSQQPGDVEGQLLLASVQRRTRRLDEAKRTLDRLRQCELAARWAREIQSEERRIEEIEHESGQTSGPDENPPLARAA